MFSGFWGKKEICFLSSLGPGKQIPFPHECPNLQIGLLTPFHGFLPLACPTVHEKQSLHPWTFTCFFHKPLPILRCSSHHKAKRQLGHRRCMVLTQTTACRQRSVITPNYLITAIFMIIIPWTHKHVVKPISNSDPERLLKSHVVLVFLSNNTYGWLLLFIVAWAPRQILPRSVWCFVLHWWGRAGRLQQWPIYNWLNPVAQQPFLVSTCGGFWAGAALCMKPEKGGGHTGH